MLAKKINQAEQEFYRYIEEAAGLVFNSDREPEIMEAVDQAMKEANVSDLSTFLDGLKNGRIDIDPLLTRLTVRETYFFRHKEQLKFIGETIFPQLLEQKTNGETLRLWSAGCATGEEPYSLAILAHELGLSDRVQILATDICRKALNEAERASYTSWSFRETDEEFRETYFEPLKKRFQLHQHIRENVVFEYLNLMQDNFPSLANHIWNMDLILCRNVLIYFKPEMVQSLAKRLFDSLAPGGWLLTSATDPSLKEFGIFEVTRTPSGVAYQRPLLAPARKPTLVAGPQLSRKKAEIEKKSDTQGDPLTLAEAALVQGNYEKALKTIHLAPQSEQAHAIRIEALASKLGPSSVESELASLVRQFPYSIQLLYLQSVILANLRKWKEALAIIEKLIYLDNKIAIAHFSRGCIAKQLAEYSESKRSFRNAHNLAKNSPPNTILPLTRNEYAGRLCKLCNEQLALLEEKSPKLKSVPK